MGALAVLVVTAAACGTVGTFLVLRNLAMVSDAISHTVLLGIIIGYFIVHDIDSPALFLGAALFGVLTVYAIEMLVRKFSLKSDAATGLVFPLFFALAIIMISKYARNVHICVDTVLMGEVIFAPLNTMSVLGIEMPKAFYQMLLVLFLNLLFVGLFYNQLKVSTFDPNFAASTGISVTLLHYILMTLVSITTVVAFNAVGSILVISFLVAPVLSAYLLSKRLYAMIGLSIIYGVINSVAGYFLAVRYNVSMTGMCAVVAFASFMATFIFYPDGMIGKMVKRYRLKRAYQAKLLTLYLPEFPNTVAIKEVSAKLQWSDVQSEKILNELVKENYLKKIEDKFVLTTEGKEYKKRVAQEVLC